MLTRSQPSQNRVWMPSHTCMRQIKATKSDEVFLRNQSLWSQNDGTSPYIFAFSGTIISKLVESESGFLKVFEKEQNFDFSSILEHFRRF